jgi:hypothetical protein
MRAELVKNMSRMLSNSYSGRKQRSAGAVSAKKLMDLAKHYRHDYAAGGRKIELCAAK